MALRDPAVWVSGASIVVSVSGITYVVYELGKQQKEIKKVGDKLKDTIRELVDLDQKIESNTVSRDEWRKIQKLIKILNSTVQKQSDMNNQQTNLIKQMSGRITMLESQLQTVLQSMQFIAGAVKELQQNAMDNDWKIQNDLSRIGIRSNQSFDQTSRYRSSGYYQGINSGPPQPLHRNYQQSRSDHGYNNVSAPRSYMNDVGPSEKRHSHREYNVNQTYEERDQSRSSGSRMQVNRTRNNARSRDQRTSHKVKDDQSDSDQESEDEITISTSRRNNTARRSIETEDTEDSDDDLSLSISTRCQRN